MISVEEAQRRILEAFTGLQAENVSLGEALGRTLAHPVTAALTQPPADVSAMDGYAVRAADVAEVPVALTLAGTSSAGEPYDGELAPGQAVRIFTGAYMPSGSDTVIIQENTERESETRVLVTTSAKPGTYVRAAGLDFREGEVGLEAGRQLSARDIGLAAAMNRPWLKVVRRPRVAILGTGDEIVLPGEVLRPGQIVSSNTFSLECLVRAFGGEPMNLGIVPDQADAIASLAAEAKGSDLIITSGGASVGDRDLVRGLFDEGRFELDFWKIAMRPGKPLLFGRVDGTPLLGLPGNPVSSVVCSLVFVRPAIHRMLGRQSSGEHRQRARLTSPLRENDHREDYMRARLTPGDAGLPEVEPFLRQDSSMMALLAAANCLIVRPPHAPAAKAGDEVEVLSFGSGLIAV